MVYVFDHNVIKQKVKITWKTKENLPNSWVEEAMKANYKCLQKKWIAKWFYV